MDKAIQGLVSRKRETKHPSEKCPEDLDLVLYLEDALDESEKSSLEHHLASCPYCLDLLVVMADINAEDDTVKVNVPRDITRRAKSIVSARPFGPSQVLGSFAKFFWNRWTFAWAVPLLLILLIPVGWLTLQPEIQKVVTKQAQRVFNNPDLTLEGINVGWRSVFLNGLVLSSGDKRTFSFGDASVVFSLKSLTSGEFVVDKMTLETPYLLLSRSDPNDSYSLGGISEENLAQLFELPFRFDSSKIFVSEGSFLFEDTYNDQNVMMKLKDISITAKNFSYPAPSVSTFHVEGHFDQPLEEGFLVADGQFDTATGNLEVAVAFKQVDLTVLKPYFAARSSAQVTRGTVDAEFSIKWIDNAFDLAGNILLRDIEFSGESGDFLGVSTNLIYDALVVWPDGLRIPCSVESSPQGVDESFVATLLDNIEKGLAQKLKSENK